MFLAAGISGQWFWFLPALVSVLATIATIWGFVRNTHHGCSVDNQILRWWNTGWPTKDESVELDDILKIQLHTRGETNQLRILKTDRTVVEIDDWYIGGGRAIYDELVAQRPNIDACIDGEWKW